MITLTGVKATQVQIRKKALAIRKEIQKALLRNAFLIQRESQKLVPVEHSNLKGSAFVVGSGMAGGSTPSFTGEDAGKLASGHAQTIQEAIMFVAKDLQVAVGYSAYYALFVHENMEARHGAARKPKPGGPNQQAKYLSQVVEGRRTKVLADIAKAVNKGAGL